MEFGEKLQQLRKDNSMTQEQLAEKLFVSRTAVSKWESCKGYPGIDSLKNISKIFSVSIDDLLSGEELVSLAQEENRENINNMSYMIMGIIDLMAVLYIILPLYGKTIDGYIYSVNLFNFDESITQVLFIYWIVFILMIITGAMEIIFHNLHREKLCVYGMKFSLFLHGLMVMFFAATREPYVTMFLFLFFAVKIFLLLKYKK